MTLRLTQKDGRVDIDEVGSKAGSSPKLARKVLSDALGRQVKSTISITPSDRFNLALLAARGGSLDKAAESLSWQEFEEFTEECLQDAGFEVERNIRFKGTSRRWQIDVVGTRNQLVLCIDCKRWKPPNYKSKFTQAVLHSKASTQEFLNSFARARISEGDVFALPIILTVKDPPQATSDGVIILSILKLANFLQQVSPFSEGLPFILPSKRVQNPIRAVSTALGD